MKIDFRKNAITNLIIHHIIFASMKARHLSVAAILLAATVLTSSCVGSFSLFNKLAQWNKGATKCKFLNEIIFIVITPAYAVCSIADALVLNSIEFWTGDNPVASNIGKTTNVLGEDGNFYAVKPLKNGYEITAPNGEVTTFIYNKKHDSWSQVQNGKTTEIFRFNEDGTIQVNLGDKKMNVTVDEIGLNEVAAATGHSYFYAAR